MSVKSRRLHAVKLELVLNVRDGYAATANRTIPPGPGAGPKTIRPSNRQQPGPDGRIDQTIEVEIGGHIVKHDRPCRGFRRRGSKRPSAGGTSAAAPTGRRSLPLRRRYERLQRDVDCPHVPRFVRQ